jgi:hypothetical protein
MIPLTKGFYAYVDAADYEWLNQWHWRALSSGYAGRYEKGKRIFMHRQIMQPPPGKVVDHVNGNGFDNTRINMRNITKQQNNYNHGKRIGAITSIYKGVRPDGGRVVRGVRPAELSGGMAAGTTDPGACAVAEG